MCNFGFLCPEQSLVPRGEMALKGGEEKSGNQLRASLGCTSNLWPAHTLLLGYLENGEGRKAQLGQNRFI